jgi:hypothetical protein
VDEYFPAILGVVGSLLGALIGGGATLWVAIRTQRTETDRYARQRIWDARKDAYTGIVAGLAALQRQSERIDYNFSDDAGGENFHGSDLYRRSTAALGEMHRDFERTLANGRLMLSESVYEAAAEMLRSIEEIDDDPNQTPPERYEALAAAYKQGAERTLRVAQSELIHRIGANA